MRCRKAQFDFVWLFAIIAGGAILVLAIYGVMNYVNTERNVDDSKIAQKISSLIDPMQAGFTRGKKDEMIFNQETRINNNCIDNGFGENRISVSTRSSIGREWNEARIDARIKNKYIFSSEKAAGKKYYIFSKPFRFPYKVADLIYMTPESYCFVGASDEIKKEISKLRISNIEIDNCTSTSALEVCFDYASDCDIKVNGNEEMGTVTKSGKTLKYYTESLMFAAIFSDKDIYDCNVKRLMYRTSKIAEGLSEKTDLMNARDCGTNLKPELISWKSMTAEATSDNFVSLKSTAESLENRNERESCGVWS